MKPIIFGGDMVLAILEGRKTQTRRAVIPSPPEGWSPEVGLFHPTIVRRGVERPGPEVFGAADEEFGVKCPYGQPGDRLWVREKWTLLRDSHWHDCGKPRDAIVPDYRGYPRRNAVEYAAGATSDESERCRVELGYKWRSPIHMPRCASRITLEITAISVERLQTTNPWVWVIEFRRVDPCQ